MSTYRKRKFECDECPEGSGLFEAWVSDGEIPPCPRCNPNVVPFTGFPQVRDSTRNASKAIDFAQQMSEREFGLTDINDNQRAGDVAYKAPPPPTAREFQETMQQQAEIAASLSQTAQLAVQNLRMGNLAASWQPGGATVVPRAGTPVGESPIEQTKQLASRALNGPRVSQNYTGE